MTCREAERLVTPYIQDKLSGDELEAFLEHLEHCRNCQEELEIYFMVDVGLKQLDTGSGTFDIMGALQKRIAESYARVRRMALPENGVCGQYAGRDGGIGDGDAAGQDLAGTIEKSNK